MCCWVMERYRRGSSGSRQRGRQYHLSNLTVILDYNDVQLDGAVHEIMPLEPLAERWKAFGFHVIESTGIMRQVVEALDWLRRSTANRPSSSPTPPRARGSYMEMTTAGTARCQSRSNISRR